MHGLQSLIEPFVFKAVLIAAKLELRGENLVVTVPLFGPVTDTDLFPGDSHWKLSCIDRLLAISHGVWWVDPRNIKLWGEGGQGLKVRLL